MSSDLGEEMTQTLRLMRERKRKHEEGETAHERDCNQCDQIGRFLKVLVHKLSFKNSPINGDFCGILKTSIFK